MDYEKLGLKFIPDFITKEEEEFLLSHIPRNDKNPVNYRNTFVRYGSNYPYGDNIVSSEIPPYYDIIAEKIYNLKLTPIKPISVTVNEYLKGQGVPPHIDGGDIPITIISLLDKAIMQFDRPNGANSFRVELLPRSLCQMSGEIRTNWRHHIIPLEAERRYSIVFRCGLKS